jgi:hypothetical protein
MGTIKAEPPVAQPAVLRARGMSRKLIKLLNEFMAVFY